MQSLVATGSRLHFFTFLAKFSKFCHEQIGLQYVYEKTLSSILVSLKTGVATQL
jgi:hypothetical protein